MFSLKGGQGFQITFENGYTVSVQFGEYHYCSNRNLGSPTCEETVHDCANAETAIFYKGDKFLEYKGGDVQSYQSPKEVLETLKYAESLPNPECFERGCECYNTDVYQKRRSDVWKIN